MIDVASSCDEPSRVLCGRYLCKMSLEGSSICCRRFDRSSPAPSRQRLFHIKATKETSGDVGVEAVNR